MSAGTALAPHVIAQGGGTRLPDTDQWVNRIEIRSETSSRKYTIAQRRSDGTWACSCPGNKAHGDCKHLRNMLPRMGIVYQPTPKAARRAPRTLAARARVSFSFSDAAYRHYDTSEGFGSADEWMAAAEELASGRSTLRDEPKARKRTRYVDPRLRALGLDAMPTDIRGLKRAFREALFRTHPDHGGTSEACREVLSAYEQLVRRY